MTNEIKTGISQALDTEFNTKDKLYQIYSEVIENGFDKPCFYILRLKARETQLMGNRYKFESTFDIQYFPSNDPVNGILKKNEECDNIAEILTTIMKEIIVDSSNVRGTNINYENIDDVLHFYVDYNLITKRVINNNIENMQNLNANMTVS